MPPIEGDRRLTLGAASGRVTAPRIGGTIGNLERVTAKEAHAVKALKTVAVALGVTLGALIVIPLIVLAGLFVWLKLTEEDDEEALELEQEGA